MEYAALSDKGIKRRNNEDSYLVNQTHRNPIFIVADGMGGHNAGEVASMEACRIVESYLLCHDGNIADVLEKAVKKANRDIFVRASENESMTGMGTTIDVCVTDNDVLYAAHVGDSRVYIVTEDDIVKITKDHSIVGEMVEAGTITEEEARVHPKRNYITRAVGSAMGLKVDITREVLHKGEIVLMCTDGLTNMVKKDDIRNIIAGADSLECAVQELVKKAKENGGDDNITAVLFKA